MDNRGSASPITNKSQRKKPKQDETHLHQLYKDLYITDYENKIADLKEKLKENVEHNMEQTMTIDKLKKDN